MSVKLKAGAVVLASIAALVLPPGPAQAAGLPGEMSFTFTDPYGGYGTYKIPLRSGSFAMADFDGDGRPDAAVAGAYIPAVAILFNTESGPVQTWVPAGRWPIALAAGDLDGDGDVDLAVVNRGSASVLILNNPGDGHLVPTDQVAVGQRPESIAATNLDGAAGAELVVACRTSKSVCVLQRTAGTWSSRTYALPEEPNAVVAADLDKDGDADVAVACASSDAVRILRNDGGELAVAGVYEGGPYPVALAAADLDADGDVDLATADREAPQITVLLNNGQGQFSQTLAVAVPAVSPPLPGRQVDLLLADLDYDGDVDIHTAGVTLANNGSAAFTATGPAVLEGLTLYALVQQAPQTYPFLGRFGWALSASLAAQPMTASVSYARKAADITDDGRVDVFDVIRVVLAFGAAQGDAAYTPWADTDGSGMVDVFDVINVVLAFGWQKA